MGYANRDLITACERARKVLHFLSAQVEDSQAQCPHPLKDRRVTATLETSPTGKYQAGDTIAYCARCSGVVHHVKGSER